MRRQRIIFLLITIAAVLAIPAVGTTAPGDQVRGPGCGNITLWNSDKSDPPQYSSGNPAGSTAPTVYAVLTTAKASCSGFVYTINLYQENGTTLITSQTYNGDDATSEFPLFTYEFPTTNYPQAVCISATSTRDGRVIDAAPDSGCAVRTLDGGIGGGSGLN
jgi:hypothetical protein